MNLNDFLLKTYIHDEKYQVRPAIVCKDGFFMSIQEVFTNEDSLQGNDCEFEKVEVGYPSPANGFLKYIVASVDVVQQVIDEHDGIDESKTFRKL